MENLSQKEKDRLPQLVKKFNSDKSYFNFIINRGNSLMTRREIQFSSHKTIKHAEDLLIWYALFHRY